MTQRAHPPKKTFLALRKLFQLPLLAFAASFIFSQDSKAQPFFIPTAGLKSVLLANTSAETQHLWVAVPVDPTSAQPKEFQEVHLEIPAGKTLRYVFQDELNHPWVQLKSYDHVQVKVTAQTQYGDLNIAEGRSEALISSVFSVKASGTLVLVNLSANAQQDVLITSNPRNSKAAINIQLAKFATQKVGFAVNRGDRIRIKASYPIAASFLADNGKLLSLRPDRSPTHFKLQAQGSYFEMINNVHDQSFIFYSEDAKLIQEARYQIENPLQRKILFASIQLGHGQTNRNLSSEQKTPWSWSVSEVHGFGFFGSLACDGSPAIVEDYLLPWLSGKQGICFWGYRILRELHPHEVQTGLSPQ